MGLLPFFELILASAFATSFDASSEAAAAATAKQEVDEVTRRDMAVTATRPALRKWNMFDRLHVR